MPIVKTKDFEITKISSDIKFVLDTNILYFIHSGYYHSSSFKSREYSNVIQQIMVNGNPLIVSTLSIQELLFRIENKEYLMYCAETGKDSKNFSKKSFRNMADQRVLVQKKLTTILTEIRTAYSLLDGFINQMQIVSLVNQYTEHHYDPIDYIMVDNTLSLENVIYISDDSDFQFDKRVNVITV